MQDRKKQCRIDERKESSKVQGSEFGLHYSVQSSRWRPASRLSWPIIEDLDLKCQGRVETLGAGSEGGSGGIVSKILLD